MPYEKKMNISPELHEKWKLHRRVGDALALKDFTGYSLPTITYALKHGYVKSQDLAEKITEFFVTRKDNETKLAAQL